MMRYSIEHRERDVCVVGCLEAVNAPQIAAWSAGMLRSPKKEAMPDLSVQLFRLGSISLVYFLVLQLTPDNTNLAVNSLPTNPPHTTLFRRVP
jgi:hypothetical protein